MKRGAMLMMVALATVPLAASGKKTTMEKLPVAVQEAVTKEAKGTKVRGLTVEIEDGKTTYGAELYLEGRSKDVSFDHEGRVVVSEEVVPLAAVPPSARDVILNAAGGGRVTRIERVTENDTTVFEAHLRSGLKTSVIRVDPQGNRVD